MKNQNGFTMVELMVTVAIVGIMASLAYPNFKKYQAKQKTMEAKIELANAYQAQQGFFADYGIYGPCLRYMGYDPAPRISQRHYAIGLTWPPMTIDATQYQNALNNGLDPGSCSQSLARVDGDGNTLPNGNLFWAGKGVGSTIANASFTGYASAPVNGAGSCASSASVTGAGGCLGTQADETTRTFQIIVIGFVSPTHITGALASQFNIDSNKVIDEVSRGY